MFLFQVKCWNEANGCNAVLEVSKISKHYLHECDFHLTRCPKCSDNVLSNDVCAHLRLQCRALLDSVLSVAKTEKDTCREQKRLQTPAEDIKAALLEVSEAQLAAFKAMLDDRVGEMGAGLERLFVENSSQNNRLNVLSHDVNVLRETVQHTLQGPLKHNDSFLPNAAKADTKEDKPKGMNDVACREVTTLLQHMSKAARTHEWVLDGYGELIRTASRQTSVECWSERVYLCGFYISPGVVLEKDEGYVVLQFRLRLEEVEVSKFHNWPLDHNIRLRIIDPYIGPDRHLSVKPTWYSNPEHGHHAPHPTRSTEQRFYNTDLHDAGYVKNDQLILTLELVV